MKPRRKHSYCNLLKTALLILTFSLAGQWSYAQTIDILEDSLYFWSPSCPTPVSGNAYVNGETTGLTAGDVIEVKVFWGDGSSDTSDYTLTGTGPNHWYYSNFNHVYSIAGTYFPVVIVTETVSGIADTANFIDSAYVSTTCVTISGQIYDDQNNNCQYDLGEDSLANSIVRAYTSGGVYLSSDWVGSSGVYSMDLPSGLTNVSIEVQDFLNRSVVCPTAGSYTINTSTSQTLDFALECMNSGYDRFIYSNAYFAPPGQSGWLWVRSSANFCDSSSIVNFQDTITLELDSLIQYTGMIQGPAPDVINGNTFTWYFDYTPYWSYQWAYGPVFKISTLTDTTLSLFDTVCYDFNHGLSSQDTVLTNDFGTRCPQVGVSYDPNNKLSFPQGVGASGNIDVNTQTMRYQINFQNTGTAPATHVYLLDSISDKLDISSIRVIDASHTMTYRFLEDRKVRFDFQHINLIDSTTNEPESHGHVVFAIDLAPGQPVGTVIENTAGIYFDYNEPIITNTTVNTLYIAPTPPPDSIEIQFTTENVTCMDNDNGTINLKPSSGLPPYTYLWSNNATTEDLESLSPGTYTVTITDDYGQTAVAETTVGENRFRESPVFGDIEGAVEAQSWTSYTYTAKNANAQEFSWEVDNGYIVSSANNQVDVFWRAGPKGVIHGIKTDEHGCMGGDSLIVNIEFVGVEETADDRLRIFPNPAQDVLNIQSSVGNGSELVQVFDPAGRIVFSQQVLRKTMTVNIGHLSSGLYTVRLSDSNGVAASKLLMIQ